MTAGCRLEAPTPRNSDSVRLGIVTLKSRNRTRRNRSSTSTESAGFPVIDSLRENCLPWKLVRLSARLPVQLAFFAPERTGELSVRRFAAKISARGSSQLDQALEGRGLRHRSRTVLRSASDKCPFATAPCHASKLHELALTPKA